MCVPGCQAEMALAPYINRNHAAEAAVQTNALWVVRWWRPSALDKPTACGLDVTISVPSLTFRLDPRWWAIGAA